MFVFGKMNVFGQKWLFSGTCCCTRAKVSVLGKSGGIWAKVVVFGQNCCVRAKMIVFGQK